MKNNKTRTALTILGMVIGISAVIIVFSAGEGIRGLVVGQVESFGTDILETEIKVPSTKKGAAGDQQSGAAIAQGVQITTLKISDMEKINKILNVITSYAGTHAQDQVSYQNELKRAMLYAISSTYIDIGTSEVGQGRFFTEEEDKSLAQVAVLGTKVKNKLFGDEDPLGKYITIHRSKYRVIGVMKERGSAAFMDFDDYIYVPIRTAQKRILGIDHVFFMVHKLKDLSIADETADEIRSILRERHNISDPDKDDFRVVTMAEMMDVLNTITGALTLLLLAIVAISLVVGGVGIMNIMYVAVTERTSEIGLRKAVGAKYIDIMKQFLFEAVIITLLGGLIGIVVGICISALIAWSASNFLGLDWKLIIPAKAFITAIVFSLLFGLVFGVYPAKKAAKLNPIDALRSE